MQREFQRKQKNLNNLMRLGFGLLILTFILIFSLGKESNVPMIPCLSGLGLIGYVIVARNQLSKEYTESVLNDSKTKFSKLGLNEDEFIFNLDNTLALKLDENSSNMIFVSRKTNLDDFKRIDIPFSKILDVTVTSNGSSLLSINKGGLVGGAMVGGALFGGFGSVVGALSANKSSSELIHNMHIIITVDNLDSPIIRFDVIDSEKGIDKNSEIYKQTISIVDEWFGKFTVIMKRNEKLNNIS